MLPKPMLPKASLQLRAGTARDIPLIRELAERTWWPAYGSILEAGQIRYMLDELYAANTLREQMEAGHEFLLVTESDRTLGFASWSLLADASGTGKLHKIYVLPQAQGTGAGRFLLGAVETAARRRGCGFLELNVNRFNTARHFYEKSGFKVLRTADIPIGPYFMNDYIMGKQL